MHEVMAWIQCLLWITLAIISGPACTTPDWTKYHHGGNRHFHATTFQHNPSYGHHEYYDNHRGYEWGGYQQPLGRQSESPVQRVNERSISVTSSIQNVQEGEEKRLEPRIDVGVSRIQNGSYKIINDFAKTHPTIQNRGGAEDDVVPIVNRDKVVFPETSTREYVPEIPEECRLLGVCEDVPNYPESHVDKIIKQLGDVSEKFKIDELYPPDISQRYGAPDEIELCEYKEKIMMPRAAQNRDGEWHYIINQKETPLQGFRVEICESTGSCNPSISYFPAHVANCKQKWMLRHMKALDKAGQIMEGPFALPSCCSCVLTPNDL